MAATALCTAATAADAAAAKLPPSCCRRRAFALPANREIHGEKTQLVLDPLPQPLVVLIVLTNIRVPVHLHELDQLRELRVPRLLPHLETIPSPPVPIETQRLQLVDAILGIHILLKVIHVALVQDPQPKAGVGNGDVAISMLGLLGPELVEPSLPLVHGQAQFPQLLGHGGFVSLHT